MAKFDCMKHVDPDEIRYTNQFEQEVTLSRKDYEYYIRYYVKGRWYLPENYWIKDSETVRDAIKYLRSELGNLLVKFTIMYQHRKVTQGLPGSRIGSRNTDRCTDDDLISSASVRTARW